MQSDMRSAGAARPAFGLLLFALVLAFGAFSQTASAENSGYAGAQICADCHEETAQAFRATVHGKGKLEGWKGGAACETCHGPGKAHVDSGGEPDKIQRAETDVGGEMCLDCHGGDTAAHWRASAHEDADVTCSDCHQVHAPWTNERALVNRNVNDSCLKCHNDMRKHLFQRSSHPMRYGQMSCVDCHNPHGSDAEGMVAAVTPNDKCYECHADKRGPYLYEHAPVREDCKTCHNPHGSNQTMLLKTSAPRLCQSCHLFGHHQTVPGQPRQVWNQNRSCLNCHPRIHGSNHPSGVIFMR